MPLRKLLLLALLVPGLAFAQAFPAKPVRIVIPLPPGGSIDNTFRIVSDRFQQLTGQNFVIDNRPGASGIIAAETVMRAPADGYTLLAASITMMSINPHTLAKLPYDPQKDFIPITNVYRTNYFWVVGPATTATNLKEYVAWARQNPDKASFGSAGIGSISHLASELFNQAAGIQLLHIPYKGAVQSMTDLVSGRVSAVFAPVIAFGENARAGKVKVLAVATEQRVSAMPDVPTFTESGFDVVAPLWTGVVAPTGTPAAIVEQLNKQFVQALNSADVRERFQKVDQEPVPTTTAQFAEFMRTDRERWGKAVRAAGIKPQ